MITRFFLGFFISFLLLPLAAQPSGTEAAPGPATALQSVFAKADLMVAISNADWRPGLCLAAAPLAVGRTISLRLNLRANHEYTFIASAALQQSDLDLILRDTSGRVVADDLEADGSPIINFSPAESGAFQLQLHLVAANVPSSFVALSLLRSDGASLLKGAFQRISQQFFRSARALSTGPQALRWLQQTDQWCVYGFMMPEQGGISLQGLRGGEKKSVFAATPGPELRRIDLYLADQSKGIVARAENSGAFPLLQYSGGENEPLDLRVEVVRGKGPELLLLGVFQ